MVVSSGRMVVGMMMRMIWRRVGWWWRWGVPVVAMISNTMVLLHTTINPAVSTTVIAMISTVMILRGIVVAGVVFRRNKGR